MSTTIEQAEFRAALGHFASGVVVLTAVHGDEPVGLTCQSFFSLSMDPPLVAVAPGKGSTSWPRVAEAVQFCANVLAEGQESLARAFANSGADKFAGVGWSLSPFGAPRLHESLAWLDCSVEAVYDGGDHHLVVARVIGLETSSARPLLFYRGGFGGFQS